MACYIFSAKPWPKPLWIYYYLDSQERSLVNFLKKYLKFLSWKCIWNCHLQTVGQFQCVNDSSNPTWPFPWLPPAQEVCQSWHHLFKESHVFDVLWATWEGCDVQPWCQLAKIYPTKQANYTLSHSIWFYWSATIHQQWQFNNSFEDLDCNKSVVVLISLPSLEVLNAINVMSITVFSDDVIKQPASQPLCFSQWVITYAKKRLISNIEIIKGSISI